MKILKVLLVNPPRYEGIPVIREERCEITERYSVLPPYSLLQVAGMLREQNHQVRLIDANGLNMNWEATANEMRRASYDALVFRFTPTTFDADMATAELSKKIQPSAYTVGICWTLRTLPREVLRAASTLDVYIMHEYEAVTPTLFQNLSNYESLQGVAGIAYRGPDGDIYVNQPAGAIDDYDSMPLPAFDLLESLMPYHINTPHGKPFTIMYASKGCPFACTFCTVRRTSFKKKSADSIMRELKYVKSRFGLKTVSFFDETFTMDRKRVLQLSEQMQTEHLGIKWYCNTRVELVTKDLLQAMQLGGCRGISFGVESGSQQILDNIQKGNTVEEAETAIKLAKQSGIKVYCSFIIGLPGETRETIEDTAQFIRKTRPTGAQINVAVPYPGTPMYELAVEEGWIKPTLDWRDLYQHKANIQTGTMTSEELERARRDMYAKLYFNPRWFLGNVAWVLRHPEDFYLGTRYFAKAMKNYFFNKMMHAH